MLNTLIQNNISTVIYIHKHIFSYFIRTTPSPKVTLSSESEIYTTYTANLICLLIYILLTWLQLDFIVLIYICIHYYTHRESKYVNFLRADRRPNANLSPTLSTSAVPGKEGTSTTATAVQTGQTKQNTANNTNTATVTATTMPTVSSKQLSFLKQAFGTSGKSRSMSNVIPLPPTPLTLDRNVSKSTRRQSLRRANSVRSIKQQPIHNSSTIINNAQLGTLRINLIRGDLRKTGLTYFGRKVNPYVLIIYNDVICWEGKPVLKGGISPLWNQNNILIPLIKDVYILTFEVYDAKDTLLDTSDDELLLKSGVNIREWIANKRRVDGYVTTSMLYNICVIYCISTLYYVCYIDTFCILLYGAYVLLDASC